MSPTDRRQLAVHVGRSRRVPGCLTRRLRKTIVVYSRLRQPSTLIVQRHRHMRSSVARVTRRTHAEILFEREVIRPGVCLRGQRIEFLLGRFRRVGSSLEPGGAAPPGARNRASMRSRPRTARR